MNEQIIDEAFKKWSKSVFRNDHPELSDTIAQSTRDRAYFRAGFTACAEFIAEKLGPDKEVKGDGSGD